MDKKVIEIEELVKIYKLGDVKVVALSGVRLDIEAGEFVAVMGPSGSGKSTLMNIIGCLDVPTSGIYKLDGIDINKVKDANLAEIRNKKIGFVFQTFNLLAKTNVIGNVELPLVYSKSDKSSTRKERVGSVIESVGLKGWERHRPNELSGGQRQRVAIARALINDPAIILADEPTGNLDSETGKFVMNFLSKLNKEGKTVILITHDIHLVKYAKRIVMLKDGVIIKDYKHAKGGKK